MFADPVHAAGRPAETFVTYRYLLGFIFGLR